jgi:DoxX-like family
MEPASRTQLWSGRILSALAVLFLLLDGGMKVLMLRPAVEGTVQLGYPSGTVPLIGAILLVCTALYVVPRTSFYGLILLTAYLGGAVASNFRLENPLFSHTLFPCYVAVLLWGGLALSHPRLRALLLAGR